MQRAGAQPEIVLDLVMSGMDGLRTFETNKQA